MTEAAKAQTRIDSLPSLERQVELREATQANRKAGKAPYEDVKIETYGELLWIMRQSRRSFTRIPGLREYFRVLSKSSPQIAGNFSDIVDLRKANLQGINLQGLTVRRGNLKVDFRGASLAEANLEGVVLENAYLAETDMRGANLRGADLSGRSRLTKLGLYFALLITVVIYGVIGIVLFQHGVFTSALHSAGLAGNLVLALTVGYVALILSSFALLRFLQSASTPIGLRSLLRRSGPNLRAANLENANLSYRTFPNAVLCDAELKGTDFTGSVLVAADLRGARFNNTNLSATDLRRANVDTVQVIGGLLLDSRTRLEDVQWEDTPLRVVTGTGGGAWRQRVAAYRDSGRVYRTIGRALREQGLTAQAITYRLSEIRVERKADFWGAYPASWLGSWILNILAGYGYRPGRTLSSYLVVIAGFAWGFMQVTHGVPLFGLATPTGVPPLQWYEAAVLSVSAFHGRGFFQPLQNPGDPVAILAAAEAVLGLLIEVSFIATFTQRFFGK